MDTPEKGLKVLEVFMEFEKRFWRLFTWDQTILMLDKVDMFLHAMDFRDRYDLRILLEDETKNAGSQRDDMM